MMSQEEFDAIYPNRLTPKQHKVLEGFLKGDLDKTIAKYINPKKKLKPNSVASHISNICQDKFNIKSEPDGRYTQREELIRLFVEYKRELVCEELIKEYGKRTPEPRKIL